MACLDSCHKNRDLKLACRDLSDTTESDDITRYVVESAVTDY